MLLFGIGRENKLFIVSINNLFFIYNIITHTEQTTGNLFLHKYKPLNASEISALVIELQNVNILGNDNIALNIFKSI